MLNLVFPQLSSGALAQYPIRVTKFVRTVVDSLDDGSQILYYDPDGGLLQWQLSYLGISPDEAAALQSLFDACGGRFRAFTFLDPAANLLSSAWQIPSSIQATGSIYTNTASAAQEISQTLPVPAGYYYCFSLVAAAAGPGAVTMIRRGASSEARDTFAVTGGRLVSAGVLSDAGTQFTVAIELQPGQRLDLGQMQLEAQLSPSPYRAATTQGGVYTSAHWAVDELLFTAEGPASFSTKLTIEAHV